MLVLTIKNYQSFTIGDDIRITIMPNSSHGGGVRVGIEAPRSLNIVRDNAKSKTRTPDVEDDLPVIGCPLIDVLEDPPVKSFVEDFDDYRDCHGGHTSGGL